MKALILKHTGLTEPQFYAKYGTPEAFFGSKSGKAFQAKYGSKLTKAQSGNSADRNNDGIPDYLQFSAPRSNQYTGTGNVQQTFGSGIVAPGKPNFGPQQYAPGPQTDTHQLTDYFNMNNPMMSTSYQNKFAKPAQDWADPTAPTGFKQPKKPSQKQALSDKISRGLATTEGTIPKGTKKPRQPGKEMTSDKAAGLIGAASSIMQGFQNLGVEARQAEEAKGMAFASNKAKIAGLMEDTDKKRMIADQANRFRNAMFAPQTGEETFPIYGVGTNVLAQDGSKMGKLKASKLDTSFLKEDRGIRGGGFTFGQGLDPYANLYGAGAWANKPINKRLSLSGDISSSMVAGDWGHEFQKPKVNLGLRYRFDDGGEIQNTFAPEDIYNDLGYEPLGESDPGFYTKPSDSDIIKAFRAGGLIPRAAAGSRSGEEEEDSGLADAAQAASSIASNMFSNNAGTQIGGGIGKGIGSMFGMGELGEFFGTTFGGALDKNAKRIQRYSDQTVADMNAIAGIGNLRAQRQNNWGMFEDGGYLSHDWQPQVITHFGENSMHKLLDHAMDDMRTLRSGGNLRSNQAGDINIDGSRGKLRYISNNPNNPSPTYMIEGPSHKLGGVNIEYNGNVVEAEGGEPISERAEGGSVGETSAVITGDQTFNKMGAYEIPELSEFLGKKVKHIQAHLAKQDAKWNKLQDKNSKALADFNPLTPIDKLTFNALTMNEKGINQQYKRNALKTQSLISYQDAMNKHAEDIGVDAGELSRGKIKPLPFEEMKAYQEAEEGIRLFTQAQNGKTVYDRMAEDLAKGGEKRQLTASQKRAIQRAADAKRAQEARFAEEVRRMGGERLRGSYSFPQPSPDYQAKQQAAAEALNKALTPPDPLASLGPVKPKAPAKKAPATAPVAAPTRGFSLLKPGAYPIEPNEVVAAKKQKQAEALKAITEAINTGKGITPTFNINDPSTYAVPAKPKATVAAKPDVSTHPAAANTSNTVAANHAKVSSSPTGGSPGATKSVVSSGKSAAQKQELVPNTKDLPPLPQDKYDELLKMYDIAKAANEKNPGKWNKETEDFQKKYHEYAGDYAHAVLASEPVTSHGSRNKLTNKDLGSNVDGIFGKRTIQYMSSLNKPTAKAAEAAATTTPADTTAKDDKDKEGVYETSPYKKDNWATLAGQLLPWLRKTPGEPLLGDQLAGEMYAMSHNQEEPVQARFFHPQLDVPYDISYQDRLNENNATFRALTRAAGQGNPEALSMLAGQKYGADSNVLAEQFRANQAKKDQVYSQNRATLNQAQQYNLGLADQQYVRQQQAKSNTKMAMQEALNSVASKIGQNRLENRTLQTYANMFPDFSFGKNYNIRKTGAPTQFNMPVLYNAAGDITHVGLYDKDGTLYDYRELSPEESTAMSKSKKKTSGAVADTSKATDSTTKEARNGGLVRAFKNL